MTHGHGTNPARRTGPALEAMYRFMLWLVPTVEKFPRSQKFLLGDRIQTTALDVLERLIEATYTKARTTLLAAATSALRHGLALKGAVLFILTLEARVPFLQPIEPDARQAVRLPELRACRR